MLSKSRKPVNSRSCSLQSHLGHRGRKRSDEAIPTPGATEARIHDRIIVSKVQGTPEAYNHPYAMLQLSGVHPNPEAP